MEAAIIGFVGVIIGSLLTVAKDWWFQKSRNRKEAEYLSIQVSSLLEEYVSGCAYVVADVGEERPENNGCRSRLSSSPRFELASLKVEWKSLPASLMYEILDFPYKAKEASRSVDDAFDNATYPDFDEGFEELHLQYATLGIAASMLAAKLRKHVGLPARSAGNWDPVRYMEEQKSAIEHRRMEKTG